MHIELSEDLLTGRGQILDHITISLGLSQRAEINVFLGLGPPLKNVSFLNELAVISVWIV